jgi:hypothetical protein
MKSLGAMPIKTVLITEPEHSLLRELAMQLLRKLGEIVNLQHVENGLMS